MTLLAAAIRRKDWELVALCLLVAYYEVLRLPPDALMGLLEVAGGADAADE